LKSYLRFLRFLFKITANVSLLAEVAAFWKEFFPLQRNEVKKIDVPETEKLAMALISCYQMPFLFMNGCFFLA